MAAKKTESEQKTVNAEKEPMVKVFVPFVEGEDPEVTIYVNDDNLKFKKGYTVEIPARFAQVLENSNKQALVARENREKLKNQRQDW